MKILVRLPNALGDLVMGASFILALREQYPKAVIHIILKKELSELVELIPNNVVGHLFSKSESKGLLGLYKFGKQFRKEEFDLLFCLPNSLSSTVMCWATNAKKKIGFYSSLNALLFTKACPRPIGVHRVREYLSLLEHLNRQKIEHPSAALHLQDRVDKKDLVLLNFNSEATSRRMPIAKGRSILKDLIQQFPNTTFGLIGSPKEIDHVDQLMCNLNGNLISYAGKTNIKSLASLMKSSKLMLSTDSGPAHLANSLGVPLLVLFGAGDESNTAPFNKDNLHILRWGKLPCEPCVKNTCIYGSPKCLELLENSNIISIFKEYLIN